MKQITIIIRYILTLGLIYQIFLETGIFTAIALLLIAITLEM